MYTFKSPILYPEESSAVSESPVSTQDEINQVVVQLSTVPLGFCCGGLSSTAGYVPGNEAHKPKLASGVAPVG